jgi:hypothetical protein
MKPSLKSLSLGTILLLGLSTSCQKEFLERTPTTIILDSQLWNDASLINGLLANYYDRLPVHTTIYNGWVDFSAYDEAMWSGYNNYPNDIFNYDAFRWGNWDYGLIRDINVALDGIDKNSTSLSTAQKDQLKAEFRFLRAYMYFELVKRYGGVPLVTSQLVYDNSGNTTPLQVPRNKETEVYDFVASELDAIKGNLGNELNTGAPVGPSITRATRYTAMALKSRAMLYAASIAKYNAQSGLNISTPGGEVGIPSNLAASYYQKSLDAAKEVLAGPFSLYKGNPNLGENFYEATARKNANTEVIWVKDFLTSKDYRHAFAYDNIPRGIREDNLSSSATTPILNFVEAFENLDGTSGELKIRNAANTDYIYYNDLNGPFQNKDARLYGTVIYPGSTFKGQNIQIQAGVKAWNPNTNTYQTFEGGLGSTYTSTAAVTYPNADGKLLTGSSGPQVNQQDVSNSGFYLRKFVDSGAGTSTRGIRSDTWWVRFRLAEILLNASEAAFELGQTADALTYVNQVRARAGLTTPLTTLTLARLQNERRVELAFEDHRVWDLKRWRIAHQVWNGSPTNPSAVAYVLFPYRIVRPGSSMDGKYVFEKQLPARYRPARFFQLFNYYTFLGNDIRNRNPKIVRNPFE